VQLSGKRNPVCLLQSKNSTIKDLNDSKDEEMSNNKLKKK
jgi:hypothetical protein